MSQVTSQQQYLSGIAPLFWWMNKNKVQDLDIDSIVETVLNYGTETEVKQLFDLYGIEEVAEVFRIKSNSPRSNYFPIVKNYFDLYFAKHAQNYSH